jgi:hypothetical protein
MDSHYDFDSAGKQCINLVNIHGTYDAPHVAAKKLKEIEGRQASSNGPLQNEQQDVGLIPMETEGDLKWSLVKRVDGKSETEVVELALRVQAVLCEIDLPHLAGKPQQ